MFDLLYKNLRLPSVSNAQYQRRNGVWYKRTDGTKSWIVGDSNVQKVLSNQYKGKSALFFYSNTAKITAVLLLVGGATLYFKRKGK
jgi:hypothetical protein